MMKIISIKHSAEVNIQFSGARMMFSMSVPFETETSWQQFCTKAKPNSLRRKEFFCSAAGTEALLLQKKLCLAVYVAGSCFSAGCGTVQAVVDGGADAMIGDRGDGDGAWAAASAW
jgi:hypothetical protein